MLHNLQLTCNNGNKYLFIRQFHDFIWSDGDKSFAFNWILQREKVIFPGYVNIMVPK